MMNDATRLPLGKVQIAKLATMIEARGDLAVARQAGVSRQALMRACAGFALNGPSRTKMIEFVSRKKKKP